MTISQTAFLSEILAGAPIPVSKLAYFRRRFRNRIHSAVLSEFMRLEKTNKISRAVLARRIGCRPEQVTRWLGAPGNWTLDTVSDLLLAMACEPALSISSLGDSEMVKQASDQQHSTTLIHDDATAIE